MYYLADSRLFNARLTARARLCQHRLPAAVCPCRVQRSASQVNSAQLLQSVDFGVIRGLCLWVAAHFRVVPIRVYGDSQNSVTRCNHRAVPVPAGALLRDFYRPVQQPSFAAIHSVSSVSLTLSQTERGYNLRALSNTRTGQWVQHPSSPQSSRESYESSQAPRLPYSPVTSSGDQPRKSPIPVSSERVSTFPQPRASSSSRKSRNVPCSTELL